MSTTTDASVIVSGGTRWRVVRRGVGRPILLLHGFTGGAAAWDEQLDAFASVGRVLVPDLPGHGGTTTAPGTVGIEATADGLAALLATAGMAPASLVGYSLGARIALRLAIAHPAAVDRLVLESPSAGIEDPADRASRRAADEALAASLERDGIEAFVDRWERNPVFATRAPLPARRAAAVRATRLANPPAGLAASLREAGQGTMEPLFDRLAEVRAPTLVIAGADDAIGRPRAERVAAGIPGARVEIVAGSGHTPHDEQPDAFRRFTLAFLEETAA